MASPTSIACCVDIKRRYVGAAEHVVFYSCLCEKLKLLFLGRTPLRSNCKLVNRLLAADLLLQV